MIDQRTEEWAEFRRGFVGCSRLADVLAEGRSGPSATRRNYMFELLCERLTGKTAEHYTSPEMLRGTELEPIARSEYESLTGQMVTEHGCSRHPTIRGWIGSPDGLIGDDGMIEIRCLNTANHLDVMDKGKVDTRYIYQMAGYVEIFNRQWVDYVGFDDRLPENLRLYVKRFTREELPLDKVRDGVVSFVDELDELEKKWRER